MLKLAPLIPALWEYEAGTSLWVQSQPGLHGEFQASQGYSDCLKNKQKQQPEAILKIY